MSLVFTVCFFVGCVYFVQRLWPLYCTGWHIPGLWAVPLIGNVQMITKLKPHFLFASIAEQRERFKQTFRLWLGPQLWVFLHSASETGEALRDATLVKPDTFKLLNVLLGEGLLAMHCIGKHWETHRRALAPAFQTHVFASFVPAIFDHAALLVEKLLSTEERIIEITEYLFPCILDMIVATSMGKQLHSQRDVNSIYSRAFHNASDLLFKRMMNPLLMWDVIFERTSISKQLQGSLSTIHNLMESVIKERTVYLNEQQNITGRRGLTLLDTLLTAEVDGKPLTHREIRDEVNTFVFAGVDTTTAALSFILYALAEHPAQQLRLLEELQSLSLCPSLHEINNLEFLDMFVKESLRYYTVVPLTGRQTTINTKIGNLRYCRGVTVWLNLYGLAHDAKYFKAPQEFRPERFSHDEQEAQTNFSYLPFSGGPHVCIGRKYALIIMKIVTIELVRNFEISLGHPGEKLVLMAQMVLKSLHGINLIFRQR